MICGRCCVASTDKTPLERLKYQLTQAKNCCEVTEQAGDHLHKCAESLVGQADPEWDGGTIGYLVNELGVASEQWAEREQEIERRQAALASPDKPQ
jgi:hypothetical protein